MFYDKLTVLTIFLVYLACAAFIFACKRFVHAVFHDVTEIVQGMGTVVGYGIIVVEAYDFPIRAVKDFKVIIENQLEASNHDHLGKIITYASGLDAKVIVWIVTQAREEHRSAIEWLNNNTGNDIGFFLIELHAYRIGDSLPAPKFEIIEKPNGFIKYSKENSENNEINKSQSERLVFWTRFNEMVVAKGKPFNIRNATTDHWYNVAIGTSEACVSINLVNKLSRVTVEIYIADNKNLFDYLAERKDEIENALGFPMEWVRLDNKKASRIKYAIPGLNFDDHSNYDALIDKIIEKVIVLKKVFPEYIAQF